MEWDGRKEKKETKRRTCGVKESVDGAVGDIESLSGGRLAEFIGDKHHHRIRWRCESRLCNFINQRNNKNIFNKCLNNVNIFSLEVERTKGTRNATLSTVKLRPSI